MLIPMFAIAHHGLEERERGLDLGLKLLLHGERAANVGNLRPVEGENTHSKPRLSAKQMINYLVVRSDPRNPWKVAECGKQVSRDEVYRGKLGFEYQRSSGLLQIR